VPRIRLRIFEETQASPLQYRDPSNLAAGVVQIPLLRLGTLARIEAPPGRIGPVRVLTALIDTGAWLSVIETDAWQRLELAGLLTRLPFEGRDRHSAAIGGKATDYQLGRLWISLHDIRLGRRSHSLPAVPVVVQPLLNPDCRLPYPLVFGLHLGVLDGRRLTRRVVPPQQSPLSTDRGAFYGQEWHLETA
jgi:hypothetical protein